MAPAAMVEEAPALRPVYSKSSTVNASVLHGKRDLRLVSYPLQIPPVTQDGVRAVKLLGHDASPVLPPQGVKLTFTSP